LLPSINTKLLVLKNVPFFLSELQKASGLRVLRRLVERQRSVEESESIMTKELISAYPLENRSSFLDKARKKPPARLKPLVLPDDY